MWEALSDITGRHRDGHASGPCEERLGTRPERGAAARSGSPLTDGFGTRLVATLRPALARPADRRRSPWVVVRRSSVAAQPAPAAEQPTGGVAGRAGHAWHPPVRRAARTLSAAREEGRHHLLTHGDLGHPRAECDHPTAGLVSEQHRDRGEPGFR